LGRWLLRAWRSSVTMVEPPAGDPPAHAARERRLVQMETAMRAAVRLFAWVCAEIAFPARPRKYSGAKLHRRKLIR